MERRARFRTTFGAFFAAAALLAAACGASTDDGPPPTPPPSSGIPADAPFIDQDRLTFKPNKLTVEAGETVYFLNSETALHTVTINGINESGNMRRRDVFTWAPPEPGEYKITCDYHPQMKATITVTAAGSQAGAEPTPAR